MAKNPANEILAAVAENQDALQAISDARASEMLDAVAKNKKALARMTGEDVTRIVDSILASEKTIAAIVNSPVSRMVNKLAKDAETWAKIADSPVRRMVDAIVRQQQVFAPSALEDAMKHADLARGNSASWIEMHNKLFGLGGTLNELFRTEKQRVAFAKTPEFKAITDMIDGLRDESGDPGPISERLSTANGSVSIRMPRSLHAALLAEAEAEGVSLNQLCVAKLAVQLRAVVG